MEKTLKFLLENLCKHPNDIKIEKTEEDNFVTFKLVLHDDDKGKIIGKGGKNIKALRQILSILARKENKTVAINVE